jgi:alpha-ketoglutarate-dependent taurine dioxygenase
MEGRFRQQRLHTPHPGRDQRRVRRAAAISVQREFPISTFASYTQIANQSQLLTQNHDAQVRFKWRKNDLAIWDNRSTSHCATYDYAAARAGDRVCSVGEKPYLDPKSKSRKEAIAEDE